MTISIGICPFGQVPFFVFTRRYSAIYRHKRRKMCVIVFLRYIIKEVGFSQTDEFQLFVLLLCIRLLESHIENVCGLFFSFFDDLVGLLKI